VAEAPAEVAETPSAETPSAETPSAESTDAVTAPEAPEEQPPAAVKIEGEG
jgi:hypothetical protein